MSATLRDYGRFGLFVMNGSVAGGEKIVPDAWFSEAGSSKVIAGKTVRYGYMWWIPDAEANPLLRDAFQAEGIFGQSIYINLREKVVIVVWSARPKPTGTNTINDEDFLIYAIGSMDPREKENPKVLQRLCTDTGGICYFSSSEENVTDISKQIARDLREQYTLGFPPEKTNIVHCAALPFRSFEVYPHWQYYTTITNGLIHGR